MSVSYELITQRHSYLDPRMDNESRTIALKKHKFKVNNPETSVELHAETVFVSSSYEGNNSYIK